MRGRPRTIDREKVIRLYQSGESLQEIAEKVGSTIKTIEGLIVILKKQGEIKRRRVDNKKQGEKHNVSKLTEADVRQIYQMRISGCTYREIAQAFDVHHIHARSICTGKSWGHLYKLYKKEQRTKISNNGTDKDLQRTYTLLWRLANPDYSRLITKAYYQKNREKELERTKRWQKMAKKKKTDYFEIVRKTKPVESFGVKELHKRIKAATYATPYKYAKLCGVSTQAIYDRIKNGSLETEEKQDIGGEMRTYINLKKFPPSKGRKNAPKRR